MNAIFKACLPALLLLIALSPLAHADNLPAPMLDDPRFSFLSTVPRDDINLKYDASKIPDMFNLMTTAKGAHEEIAEYFSGYPFRATVVVVGSNPDFRLVLNVGLNAPAAAATCVSPIRGSRRARARSTLRSSAIATASSIESRSVCGASGTAGDPGACANA